MKKLIWQLISGGPRGATVPTRLENVAMIADEGAQVSEGMANEVSVDEEWIQLSPFGDFQHPRGVQRIDREAALKMENSFRSLLGKLKRKFRGVPIYAGHPDVPEVAEQFPDDRAKGWIVDLQTREDGLYGKPQWNNDGQTILKEKHYRFPSVYWDADPVGKAQGGKPIYQPYHVISVGLTNRPRIPVQALANAETQGNKMERSVLLALLGLAATGTDAEITNKITELRGLPTRVSALENAETTSKTEIEKANAAKTTAETKLSNAETRLANICKERNRLALENAITAGRLTPAEKADWEAKLEADYETNAPLLAKKEKAMQTHSRLRNIGERRTGLANAQEIASGKFSAEVKKLKAGGMAHHDAWIAAKDAHPELYAAMEQTAEEGN